MRGNIQDMQISGAFPIIFGVLGGKGFEKDGAHMFRAFAYLPMHDLHTEKFASRVHTRGRERVSQPVDRKKFGYWYILLTLSSRLLIGMHMTVYWKAMDEGAWEGPRRRNNILREQNGANTFVPNLQWIIPLFSLCGNLNVFSFLLCFQLLLSLRFSSGNLTRQASFISLRHCDCRIAKL